MRERLSLAHPPLIPAMKPSMILTPDEMTIGEKSTPISLIAPHESSHAKARSLGVPKPLINRGQKINVDPPSANAVYLLQQLHRPIDSSPSKAALARSTARLEACVQRQRKKATRCQHRCRRGMEEGQAAYYCA